MPTRPPTRCSVFDCGELATTKGRCAEHERKRPSGAHRDIAEDERNTTRWQRESRAYLKQHDRCIICGEHASTVDHIIEIADDGAMWDHTNWQPLCGPCHQRKTKAEARRRLARRVRQRREQRNEPSLAMRMWNNLP